MRQNRSYCLEASIPKTNRKVKREKTDDLPSLLVVIVNYRTADLTIRCLESLVTEIKSAGRFHVQVVDNASEDHSVERIRQAVRKAGWNQWISVMALNENGGFAYGNNAAIRSALCDKEGPNYFLLLNPDTIVQPGAIRPLLNYLERFPQIGIVGSRLEGESGDVQCSAFRAPTIPGEFENAVRLGCVTRWLEKYVVPMPVKDQSYECEWVAGASMMVRRKVFEEIGLMDEGYFLYFEEVDFCYRARKAGWKIVSVPESRVVHLEGRATGIQGIQRPRPDYWFESRRRYFLKTHGYLYALGADLARILGYSLWRLRRMLQRKPDLDPPRFLFDLVRHCVLIKGRGVT